jgi:hypothetical protein
MSARRWIASAFLSSVLGGCGFYVPDIQDLPATQGDGQLLIQVIVTSIHCEVANAVKEVIDRDVAFSKKYRQPRYAAFLDKWGAQLALTLTIVEKSSASPNAVWSPPTPATAVFTLGGGASISAEATRTDTLNFYYTVPQLYKRAYCRTGVQQGNARSLLVQSDLKLKEWLYAQLTPAATGELSYPTDPGGPLERNVLSHEVKFVVSTSANLTPAWTLQRVTVNQDGSFFAANRDRTHDLTITFGPDKGGGKGLELPAANEHLAKQIGLSVSTNLRSLPR